MVEQIAQTSLPPEKQHPTGILRRLGFNGCAVIFQLVLIAIIAMGVLANWGNSTSMLSIEMAMAAAGAGIVLAATLPLVTFTALLGLRKRLGAGRLSGQPRKVFTFDLLALAICAPLLLSPAVLLMVLMVVEIVRR